MNNQHYKDFFNRSTLQDNAFDDSKDTVVTIANVQETELTTKNGEENYLCAFLEGYDKPLRLNVTMSKSITKALGSPIITDWVGKSISIYIEKGLRAFGDVHNVPRVRSVAPRVIIDTKPAIKVINGAKSMGELQKAWKGLSGALQREPSVIAAKDKRKGELS